MDILALANSYAHEKIITDIEAKETAKEVAAAEEKWIDDLIKLFRVASNRITKELKKLAAQPEAKFGVGEYYDPKSQNIVIEVRSGYSPKEVESISFDVNISLSGRTTVKEYEHRYDEWWERRYTCCTGELYNVDARRLDLSNPFRPKKIAAPEKINTDEILDVVTKGLVSRGLYKAEPQ